MEKFSLIDRYRLELHWESVSYNKDGECEIKGAFFKGPALSDAAKLNDKDHIYIDFYSQYIYIVSKVFIGTLSWEGVHYNSDGTISLKNTSIKHTSELNKVPKLSNSDYIVIDTKGHEPEEHIYNMLYKAFVVNKDTQLYKFGKV